VTAVGQHPVRIAGALCAAALLAVTLGPTAGAVPGRRAPSGSIALRGQPAWSSPGDDVPLRLAVTADPALPLEVRAVVHRAVTSRIGFERTVNGERLGSVAGQTAAPLAALPVVGSERVLTLPLQDPDASRDPGRIRLPLPGPGAVFPVEIQLRDPDSGKAVDRFVTPLVLVPRTAGTGGDDTRLRVGWLWNVAARPSTTTLGAPSPAFARELAAGGRLARIAAALDLVDDVPVTLVPNPETVDALTNAVPGATTLRDRLRDVASRSPVVAGTYTTVNGPSLDRAGLTDAVATQIASGRGALEQDLEAAIDHSVAAPQPLDAGWLGRLRDDGGTTRYVVEPDALSPAAPADQFTPARPFRLDTEAGSFDAVQVDRTASDLLVRGGSDALRAQQVLAALAVIALEQPNRVRGVVIGTPLRWDAHPARVGAVLAGLRDSPLVTPVSVGSLFDTVPAASVDGHPYQRVLATSTPAAAPVTEAQYLDARRDIDALASMLDPGHPLVAKLRHQLLLTPAARMPATGPRVSQARTRSIHRQVEAITNGVHAPPSRTFRLTSRRASVPVSVENSTDYRLTVRVRLDSQKLEFPRGDVQTVTVPPGNRTISFDVVARASGTFPVLASVSSPNGRLDLQTVRYTVRSSAVSGVGIFLTAGAALFLAGWWFVHWRRSRRTRTAAYVS